MDQGSLRSGTEFMTMLTIMIWEVQTKVQTMYALFLVDQRIIPIPEGEELVENQQKLVRVLNILIFSSVKSCYDISKLVISH